MGEEYKYPTAAERRKQQALWDSHRIKALREHLGMTQSQMAEELQVRQQTISEWEIGMHTPHRSTQKVLSMVAERAGFEYQVSGEHEQDKDETTAETKETKSEKSETKQAQKS
jgi:DNA-binding transcriptional regulator YiaG